MTLDYSNTAQKPHENPEHGQVYFDSKVGVIRMWNSEHWVSFGFDNGPIELYIKREGYDKVWDRLLEMHEIIKRAEKNELVRHHLDKLRVAVKMTRPPE